MQGNGFVNSVEYTYVVFSVFKRQQSGFTDARLNLMDNAISIIIRQEWTEMELFFRYFVEDYGLRAHTSLYL